MTADITIHKCVPFGNKEEAKDHGVRTANICTNKRMAKTPRNIRQHNEWTSAFLNRQHITNIVGHLVPHLHKPLKKLRTLSTILLGLTLIGRAMSKTMHIYIHTYLHTNAGNSNIGLKTAKGN